LNAEALSDLKSLLGTRSRIPIGLPRECEPAAAAGDGHAQGHGLMEFLLTVGNLLFVFAYFVRRTLWLRVLSLGGTTCLLAYFLTLPVPLMKVVYWNSLYAIINVVWIGRLLLRRPR
jgi:hypothetical protein